MTAPTLHGAADAGLIPWPSTQDGDVARRWLTPIVADGIPAFVGNAFAEMRVVVAGEVALPYTVSHHVPRQSYVTSPYTQYVEYGAEETGKLPNRFVAVPARMLVRGLGALVRPRSFDRVVLVNNWLLSTNLWPAMPPRTALAILDALVAAHPDHAVVFRSVDLRTGAALAETLRGAGCRLVFSRRVLYQDPSDPAVWRRPQVRDDAKLLARSGYRTIDGLELPAAARERILGLYDLLYLTKYTPLNPQFTQRLIDHLFRERLLRVTAFEKDGRIDAVIGSYVRGGVLATPLCGYDIAMPRETGLYRMLSAQSTREARELGVLVNDSAGVGRFKRLRGSTSHLEFNVVHDRHLPPSRRLPWAALRFFLDRAAAPLIERFDL